MKFYKCNVCGNVVELIVEGGGELVCCGEAMEELIPKEVDEENEKHVPVVTEENSNYHVKIGEIEHPMTPEHHIQFITIFYNNKSQKIKLKPTDKPEVTFKVEEPFDTMEIYELCNIHGLWKKTYKK